MFAWVQSCVCNNCISVYYWPLNDKKCGRLLRVLWINLYFNDEILTCLSFVSIWNIALWWVYNIYIILSYSVSHFVILYYTKFVCMFVFQCHFMLYVILCVSNMTRFLCNHILLKLHVSYPEPLGYMMDLWNVCNVNVNVKYNLSNVCNWLTFIVLTILCDVMLCYVAG
jgi:hypothetical protein